MKDILTIFKKELKRFFTDKRMIFSLILPGLLIIIIYSFMGLILNDVGSVDNDYTYSICIINEPESKEDLLNDVNHKIIVEDFDVAYNLVKSKDLDLLIFYEEGFDSKVESGNTPDVSLYYNSTRIESYEIYTLYYTTLIGEATNTTYNFLINNNISGDLATQEDESLLFIKMMLPYILLVFLFTGCMAVCTESIAGEKERGTIATLLVTPVKRRNIALGKIFALSLTSLLPAVSSFIGILVSLPRMMKGTDISISMFGPGVYIMLLGIILVTVLLFNAILSIISCYAKSIKEATQLASPIMIIVVLIGVMSMSGSVPQNHFLYFIPIYNSVCTMSGVLDMSISVLDYFISISSTLVYMGLGVFLITKMFNSEKIMFNK